MTTSSAYAPTATSSSESPEGYGWLIFAGIMLMIVGVLNVIYGIAAIGDSKFFVHNAHYVISSLNTWGWITLLLGATQNTAALSIWRGGEFGRWFGIATAGLSSIAALLSLPAAPFWSLCVFAVDILIIYGLAAHGGRQAAV
jgi:hypothetical protein